MLLSIPTPYKIFKNIIPLTYQAAKEQDTLCLINEVVVYYLLFFISQNFNGAKFPCDSSLGCQIYLHLDTY